MDATEWGSLTPAALLLMVVVADMLVGHLPGIRAVMDAPLDAVRGLTRWFDARLNRERRGGEARRMRGFIVVFLVAALAWIIGTSFSALSHGIQYGWLIDVVVLLMLLRYSDFIRRMQVGSRHLATESFSDARQSIDPLVRYDIDSLDNFGVARAAVEGGSARYTERFLALVFWYLLFGLAGAVVSRSLNAVADVIGTNSPRHQSFGFVAARVDYILNLAPAILAGPIICLAAIFVPKTGALAGVKGWMGDIAERGARPEFRGEGTVAGALGMALGGPRPFGDKMLAGSWIGNGRARATVMDVRRAILLISVTTLLVGIALALVVLYGSR